MGSSSFLEVVGRQVIDDRVVSNVVVVSLDVLEDLRACLSLVSKTLSSNSSLILPKKLSMGALSQQFPFLDLEHLCLTPLSWCHLERERRV